MKIDHAKSKCYMDLFLTKLAGQKRIQQILHNGISLGTKLQIKLTNLLKEGISNLKQKK